MGLVLQEIRFTVDCAYGDVDLGGSGTSWLLERIDDSGDGREIRMLGAFQSSSGGIREILIRSDRKSGTGACIYPAQA
jgi:hypothetical protein